MEHAGVIPRGESGDADDEVVQTFGGESDVAAGEGGEFGEGAEDLRDFPEDQTHVLDYVEVFQEFAVLAIEEDGEWVYHGVYGEFLELRGKEFGDGEVGGFEGLCGEEGGE